MKALITGITGFVGRHLTKRLLQDGVEVWGTTRGMYPNFNSNVHLIERFNFNLQSILEILNNIRPDHIYHLAGQSNVKNSWLNPFETFEANVLATIHLLEAVRLSEIAQKVKVLTVGSSEEYGRVQISEMPIKEDTELRPISPYGISKATISMLARQYRETYKINVVHVRPFNHIGPGQSLGFVTQDFAKQIVEIEKGLADPIIYVGNLDAKRDFIDVRDVVDAYIMIMTKSDICEYPGFIFNVCSAKPTQIKDILYLLIDLSSKQIDVKISQHKLRPIDVEIYVGSNELIRKVIGWEPKIPLDQSLQDIISEWRNRL